MPSLTEEQLLAVTEEGKNILVSAGAGSGKTKVLAERVLRKVENGTPISQLLLLTFTKAAAKEMKDRIRKELKKKNLQEALLELDQSYITTFDSYALSVVKKYHVELGLPKEIEITEDAILSLVKKEQLDLLFETLYEEENPSFINLLSSFAVKDDKKLKDYLLQLYATFENVLEKEEVFENYEEKYFCLEKQDQYVKAYWNFIQEKRKSYEEHLNQLLALTEGKYQESLQEKTKELLEANSYPSLKKALDSLKLPNLPKGSLEEVKACKEKLSKMQSELKALCHYETEEEMKKEILDTKENTLTLLNILLELDKRVTFYKQENELFSFMDISRFALKAVREYPKIALELKNSFAEILVDEYQDTNDIQEAFLSYLEKENLYMVGDMKQSIYRFRNANPKIFKEKYKAYLQNKGGMAISLSKNFRSRREVLSDINLLFASLMDEVYGGVTYQEGHAMVFGNQNYLNEETKQNHFLEVYTYTMEEEKTYEGYEKEIFLIAEDIKEKVKMGYPVLDKETNHLRPATYSDFAILLDRSKYFDTYQKIFEYVGIPLAIYKEDSLQGKTDIFLLKNMFLLLSCIAEKDYSSSFRHAYTSLARSFLYAEKDATIFEELSYQTFFQSPLYQTFAPLSESFKTTTPSLMLLKLLEATSYEEKLIEVGDVSCARKRMEYFYHLASSYEKDGKSNASFLQFLTTLLDEELEVDVIYQKEDANAVSLMTIHKSKGLEFPICYFADLNHDFNLQDVKKKVKWSKNYGILLPTFKEDEEAKTICEVLLKEEIMQEEISEKIRLFYVALTRAREKMILVEEKCKQTDASSNKLCQEEKRKALSFKKMVDLLYSKWKDREKYFEEIPNITKSYLLPRNRKVNLKEEDVPKITFKKQEEIVYQENRSFSKTMLEPLLEEQVQAVELGLKMHAVFEKLDFNHPNYEALSLPSSLKDAVKAFVESKFLQENKHEKMYREYEFLEEIEHTVYHGIIDLLIVKEKEAILLDYKLKHVEDPAYTKQLLGYKKVIEKRTHLPVRTFLYSILDKKLQEIFDKS